MSEYRIVRKSANGALFLDDFKRGQFTWIVNAVKAFPFEDHEDAASYIRDYADGKTLLTTDEPIALDDATNLTPAKQPKVMKRPTRKVMVKRPRPSGVTTLATVHTRAALQQRQQRDAADDAQTAADFKRFNNKVCIVEVDDDMGLDVLVGVVKIKDDAVVVACDDDDYVFEPVDVEHITPLAA